jgi:hypothetical protein
MAIVTATQVSLWTSISASAATIISKEYIPIVQERICIITNNYFTVDALSLEATVLFNATARSITLDGSIYWENYGFQANDDILIYQSWRNDGVKTIVSITSAILTLTSACSCVNERFNNNLGPAVYFSVIKWPKDLQSIACEMIYFDNDIRPKNNPTVRSHSLGPFSESFTTGENEFGYPADILNKLVPYKLARVS